MAITISGKAIAAILAVIAIVGVVGYGMKVGLIPTPGDLFQTPTVEQEVTPEEEAAAVEAPVSAAVPEKKYPIATLIANAKDKYTMDDLDNVQVRFYTPGADVSDPNVKALDSIAISDGTGQSTTKVIQTGINYDVWFNGNETYYDKKMTAWDLSYNAFTSEGLLLVDTQTYIAAAAFGAFVDVDTLPESQTGVVNDTGTDSIAYDESAGTGSMWIKADLGNANANTELKDVVLCFKDADGDMEGDEVTGLTASYVSGSTKITIPGNLLGYWRDGMGAGAKRCVSIATSLGSSEKARWEFTFTVNEANWDAGEEFEMAFDDNGDIAKREYPSSDLKADTETLTIGVQA